MAPPGVNTCNDMIISSVYGYGSYLSTIKPFSSPSLTSTLSKSTISSELSSIFSDHNYTLKPPGNMGYNQAIDSSEHCDFLDIDSCGGDAMLSSCTVVCEDPIREDSDTDFIKDLEELDFGLEDLDPCCDVEMEDSFQEFIDSALEKSSSDLLCMNFSGDKHCAQDTDIFHKEDFLAVLDLRPSEVSFSTDEIWSLNTAASEIHSTAPANQNTTSSVIIPTKRCSCLAFDCVSKAVYSTAHVSSQDCVRICPSTLVTKINKIECTNCTQSNLKHERVLSPLFIDTSSSECFESYQPLSDDHLHVSMDKFKLPEVEKDTADILKWLKESQQQDYDDINNSLSSRCENRTFTEKSHQRHFDDLESIVDLEDFLTESVDKGVIQHKDSTCQRITDHSEYESKDVSYISPLRLSFLEELPEHILDSDNSNRFNSHLDFSCEGFSQGSLTPQSSHMSHCGSPTWSVTDSNQPSPAFSLSSDSKNTFEDFSLKSQLAILKMFSEENAESLLLTDSAVPNNRFV